MVMVIKRAENGNREIARHRCSGVRARDLMPSTFKSFYFLDEMHQRNKFSNYENFVISFRVKSEA